MSDERLRSPLGRALGLGSAKEGVEHWWLQRLTAIALVPLTLWFVAALIRHLGADYIAAVAWLRLPMTAIPMLLLLLATFVHMALGLQVVIEDYVHHEGTKIASLVLVRLACWALGAAALFAVLRVAFGS
ncbi:MAG: succinate dehydrogenase, hydrophobic membrane anchor protein [Stellaceae bacterium]